MAKIITITGIPGAGTTGFCSEYQEKKGNTIVFNIGDLIYDLAQDVPSKPPIPKENLMNMPPHELNCYRDRAYERVLRDIKDLNPRFERAIIDTHAQFFWNDIYHNAYNWKYLNELDSDLYVTLIDKPSNIKNKQLTTAQGRAQDHDFRDLLLWQNIEINVTKGWADNYRKSMYVLPSKQDPDTIESLLENFFLIYFQMPMTEANEEADRRVTEFKESLLHVGEVLTGRPTPVIDPRDFDMETGQGLPHRIERIIRRQTTHRDLDHYISQSTDVVAFYPKGTTISKGVSDESTRGFETGKDAYVIFPVKQTSPFMELHKKVFESEKEFFDFFRDYMEQRLEFYRRDKWR